MRIVAVAAIGATILFVRAARAEAPPRLVEGDVTLDYRRGASTSACPDEAALRERAADAFDFHDPFVARGQTAASHMRVEIERTAAGYRGKVQLVDDDDRVLAISTEEHADCDALVWVLAHRIALAVLRKPASPSPPENPDPAPPPVPTPVPPPVPLPPVLLCDARCADQIARSIAARVAPPPPPSLTILAGGLMTAGWSADVGPGAWAGVALHFDWFSIGFDVRGTFPARAITFDARRAASITTVSGAVLPCGTWRLLTGCALLEVGSYTLLVPSTSTPSVDDTLVSLGLRAALDAPLAAGFSLRAFVDLAFHPYLPIFTVALTNEAGSPVKRWVTPLVSGALGLGIGWSR